MGVEEARVHGWGQQLGHRTCPPWAPHSRQVKHRVAETLESPKHRSYGAGGWD